MYIVRQGERVVIETVGKFARVEGPGLRFFTPILERRRRVVVQLVSHAVTDNVRTKDNVTCDVIVDLQYKVGESEADLKRFLYRRTNPLAQIESHARDCLRQTVSTITLSSLYEDRDVLASNLKLAVQPAFADCGMELDRILVRQVLPPEGVVTAMNNVVAAAREFEAQKIRSDAAKYNLVTEAEANKQRMILTGEGQAGQRDAISVGLQESMERLKLSGISADDAFRFCLEAMRLEALAKFADTGSKVIVVPDSMKSSYLTQQIAAVERDFP